MPTALIWLRDDLRLDDHPAFRAAFESGYLPPPVYVHAPEEEGAWAALYSAIANFMEDSANKRRPMIKPPPRKSPP